jgi:hypothetical protein
MRYQRGEFDWVIAAVCTIVAALIALFTRAIVTEQREWDVFRVVHHCRVVGRESSSISTGVGPVLGNNNSGGVAIITTVNPSKTGYLCDDNITYWR